ncbi:MAG TPA: hypothetical protein DIS62_01235 [Candidatus Kerfeldbacteria bacterium]|nr:hypothetical protein [Candidatus Kerfeldbacteria bacterium]
MTKPALESLGERIAASQKFTIEKKLYQGAYYASGMVRNVIFAGIFRGIRAVLKIYNDPRTTDEPLALRTFNQNNKSELLKAPPLYAYEVTTPFSGWLIMEHLPLGGKFFHSPITAAERRTFLSVYEEYRRNFPMKPTRSLHLAEYLPAHEYHAYRISRWLQLANDAEERRPPNKRRLDMKRFLPRYEQGMRIIRNEFSKRSMMWCHGHFKPKEIYTVRDGSKFYLTDFAHAKMYPEGYEFAFMIWADHLLSGTWKQPYKQWKKGIDAWIKDTRPVARRFNVRRFDALMRASLIERIIGTLLADLCASERPEEERVGISNYLYRYLHTVLLNRHG